MDTSKPGMYMGGLSPSNFVALVQNARVSYSIMRDVWKSASMTQLCQKYQLSPDVLFSRVATTGAQLAQFVTLQVIVGWGLSVADMGLTGYRTTKS